MSFSSPQDTDGQHGFGAIALVNPIDDLAGLRPFLEDQAVCEDTLAQLPKPERDGARRVIQLADALCELTEWPRETLLDELGCDARTRTDLDGFEPARLKRCQAFLELTREIAELVDTAPDRRGVVMQCSRLLKATHQDVDGLRRTLSLGEFSARRYIELGELAAAMRTARAVAGIARANPVASPNPFATQPPVHLSVERARLFACGERAALGPKVYERIAKHVQECSACHAAVELHRNDGARDA